MSERITTIRHKGKEILYIDYSSLKGQDMIAVIDKVWQHYIGKPKDSVLTITNVSNAFADRAVMDKLKEIAARCREYEKKSAVVGISGLKEILLNAVNLFSAREFKTFDTLDEAKDWIAQ